MDRDIAVSRASSDSATSRASFDDVDNAELLESTKLLVGRSNGVTAQLLAHLAEVDARKAYRKIACASLYKYCVYELRMSEDEAQRRVKAARAVRRFHTRVIVIEHGNRLMRYRIAAQFVAILLILAFVALRRMGGS